MPEGEVWDIFSDYLYILDKGFSLKIYSFVLMSNHFHLIVRCPKANLSEAMQYFMGQTSRAITKHQDRINQTYGGRFFRSEIRNDHHLNTVYKYVYRNPIEAGICRRVEDYKFSTLRGLLGFEKLIIPLVEDRILFPHVHSTLSWLNENPSIENRLAVGKALRRSVFALPRKAKNTLHPLNEYKY